MDRNYDDIINLPRPVSRFHKPMPLEKRAGQFAPFAALTGHGDAISDTGRVVDSRIELSDHEQQRLSDSLRHIMAVPECKRPLVTVRYFMPDEHKEGGSYLDACGRISKIDADMAVLVFESGLRINLADICAIGTGAVCPD